MSQSAENTRPGNARLLQQDARRLLEAAGYVVLRRKSYEHTLRELDRARNRLRFEEESAEGTREWALRAYDEQRRLSGRLTAVVSAAASLGVPIQAINEALAAHPPHIPPA